MAKDIVYFSEEQSEEAVISGRDRDRDGPEHRRDPRAGELAARERQRAREGARLRAPEPRGRRDLRARLDLQGVHRRRRARGRQGHAGARSSASRRCCTVADREIHDAEDHGYETLVHERDPQALLEHRRRADRAARSATRAVRRLDPPAWASASRPASTCRARRAAWCCRSRSTRARRWATCRSARASPSRRCRWPPAYAAIANGGILRPPHIVASVGGKQTKQPPGKRVISEATAASVRKMLEGVLGPGGTASGADDQGLRPRRQDRHGREGDQRRVLQGQVRRVVRRLRARRRTRSCSSR